MGVKVTKPKMDVTEAVMSHMRDVVNAAVKQLAEVGELCVAEARSSGNYTDRTGNLRSSIGFVVALDGKVVASSSFDSVSGGKVSPLEGRSLAESVASQTSALTLIIVAGMEYAQYVADKGFNVLDSAQILAGVLLNQLSIPKV